MTPTPPTTLTTLKRPTKPTAHEHIMSTSTFTTMEDFMEIIRANDLASSANYCYALFAALGFASALFLYFSFEKSYRKTRKKWTWMDSILCTYSICEFYVILISISSLAHRPKYMMTTNLGCAFLSFSFNVACLIGALHQTLMLFFLAFRQDSSIPDRLLKVLDNPASCAVGMSIVSLILSIILAVLRGPHGHLDNIAECQLDASPSATYRVAKFIISFVLPNIITVILLVIGKWSNKNFLQSLKKKAIFPTVILVTFFTRLYYHVFLLKTESTLDLPYQAAMMSVAEYVLFGGSCVNLVLVLWLHEPCRKTLQHTVDDLRDCITGREARSQDMTPRVVISETPENIELQGLQ
ncbi:uncharacterized protein LOC125741952 [Brienomyrus brachyistius]|uniref:uncharacterized protein LOC125741952 n=1 Tax=Brienomyrus brachyistius TaxID=42636 RepID=UPI0020B2E203|nr:uncharacterized protein LOC125741952 [Brienomyrus brachyistius]